MRRCRSCRGGLSASLHHGSGVASGRLTGSARGEGLSPLVLGGGSEEMADWRRRYDRLSRMRL